MKGRPHASFPSRARILMASLVALAVLAGPVLAVRAFAVVLAPDAAAPLVPVNLLSPAASGLESGSGGWVGLTGSVAAVTTPTHTGAGALAVINTGNATTVAMS